MFSGRNARRSEGTRARRTTTASLWLVLLLGPAVVYAGGAAAAPAESPDAVIEIWDQHWTLNADGSTVYHEKLHVRLHNDRAYGEFADPRLTYHAKADTLEVLAARVQRPGGQYVELPDYARVGVSPDATAGWPAFAAIQQQLLVLSGVEPGCLVELEYRIKSPPGSRPYLAADVRLDHRYPVKRRSVALTVPEGVAVEPVMRNSGITPAEGGGGVTRTSGVVASGPTTRRWSWTDLPGVPDEPQSTPWQTRCPRFAFSTAGSPLAWLERELAPIEAAAAEGELVSKLAAEWTKNHSEPLAKLRAIQEKLAASFNFVEFEPAWRPGPRPATQVLSSNYGTPEEAAAAFLALARAAGVPVELALLAGQASYLEDAPQKSCVSAYVLVADRHDGWEIWEARRGRIVRDATWAGNWIFRPGLADGPALLEKWLEPEESRCAVRGALTLDKDGNLAGSLTLRTTGLFVSPEGLRTTDAQKSRVAALVGRVVPDLKVESFAVQTLADGEFEATAQVKSSKPLRKLGSAFALQLAQDGPSQANVPLPLAYAQRELPVRLAGPFEERVELVIEWPKGWRVQAPPSEPPAADGDWGAVTQEVEIGPDRLNLVRTIRFEAPELAAAEFLQVRGPLNVLRAEAARTLILAP